MSQLLAALDDVRSAFSRLDGSSSPSGENEITCPRVAYLELQDAIRRLDLLPGGALRDGHHRP